MTNLDRFIRLQNPTSAITPVQFSSKSVYTITEDAIIGRPFYSDYISATNSMRLMFAVRVSDRNSNGVILPTPALERLIPITFALSGKTFDNYSWAFNYRLTLTNKPQTSKNVHSGVPLTQAQRDQYANKDGFRIDSYFLENQTTERLNLNGYTYTVKDPLGVITSNTFLTCQNNGTVVTAHYSDQLIDVSINRNQFYLFDLYLSDNISSFIGINGFHNYIAFKKTDLQLFDTPTMPDTAGEIDFSCQLDKMPALANDDMISVDLTHIWVGLSGRDTFALEMPDICHKSYNKNSGKISNLVDGTIDLEPQSFVFKPMFYITGSTGLFNEVDRTPLTINAPTNSISVSDSEEFSIYNPTETTNDTHITTTGVPNPLALQVSPGYPDMKMAYTYTDNCFDLTKIYISFWFQEEIGVRISHQTPPRSNPNDTSNDMHYYIYRANVSGIGQVIGVNIVPANNGTPRGRRFYLPITDLDLSQWVHFMCYIDYTNGTGIFYLNGRILTIAPQNFPNYPPDETRYVRGKTTFYSSFFYATLNTNSPATKMLYPMVYSNTTMMANPSYPWSDPLAMERYFSSESKPLYPGPDGKTYLPLPADFYCDGRNGLGFFVNAGQGTFCICTPSTALQVIDTSQAWAMGYLSTKPELIIRGPTPSELPLVYSPTLLEIAQEALSIIGSGHILESLEEDSFESKHINAALPRIMATVSTRDFGFNRHTFFIKPWDTKKPYDYGVDSNYSYYGELPLGISTIQDIRTKNDQIITRWKLVGQDLWVSSMDPELTLNVFKEVDYKSPEFLQLLKSDKDLFVKYTAGELASRIAGPLNSTTQGASISAQNEIYRMAEVSTRAKLPQKKSSFPIDYRYEQN